MFDSLDDFEGILGKLDEYGSDWMKWRGDSAFAQCKRDLLENAMRDLSTGPQGFYPQYLRDDLASAVREFFRDLESSRTEPTAYDRFARQYASVDDIFITFNYDIALERALRGERKWDIGTGYGFPLFTDRPPSPTTVFKLHGSVNWFQYPMQQEDASPLVFRNDLELLGYPDLRDRRVGEEGSAVNNLGTMILPDPRKQFMWEQLWLPLWDAAAAQLRSADRVFIHGYSLPEADARARNLLFKNIRPSASISVFCRSDSKRIANKFRQLGFTKVQSDPATAFESL